MKTIRPGKAAKPIPPKDSLLKPLWQVEYQVRSGKRYSQWMCQCKCGKACKVLRVRIQNGHTRSCGCLHREKSKSNIKKAQEVWVAAAQKRRHQNAN